MSQPWREASTLILTALKKAPIKSGWNYDVISLRRSAKSSFMPNGCVFPGGTTDEADSKEEWMDIFSNFGIDLQNSIKINGTVPPLIQNGNGRVPKLMSLKITAIRETFEETGILLCLDKSEALEKSNNWLTFKVLDDLNLWRSKVQKDASEFLKLCQNYYCCPDVNHIHLWSNWLTPTSMGKNRFDTAFFIGCLKEFPVAIADRAEIEKLHWISPDELLKSCKNKEIWLPPPQVYETSRLLQFQKISNLSEFAWKRSKEGCDRWMPMRTITSNGSVSILPGDSAYETSDCTLLTEPAKVDMTNEEFRAQSEILHRMEFVNETNTKVVLKNYNATNGHLLPAEL